jgi:hypothetical protein
MNVTRDFRMPLRRLACFAGMAVLAAGAGCASQGKAKRPAWQPLFDGQDLAGWTVKSKPADQGRDFWRVEDGCIVANSMGRPNHDYVWLVSDREFSDFVLRLSFQAYRDSPGNSGVQVWSRYDDQAGWMDGPQIDIHPAGPWRTGMIWDETRGSGRWLFPRVPPGKWVDQSMANPDLVFYYDNESPGWNTLEIRAVAATISATLNGVPVTSYDGAGVLDDAVHQAHNVGTRGHIALQIHTGDELKIRFKDIQVMEPQR